MAMDLAGKRLLLVGGAGFIGSHACDALLREDVAELRIYDNFSRGSVSQRPSEARTRSTFEALSQ
jgi:UDP-glucose 4-epimerase